MSYRLDPRRDLGDEVRRVARRELERAAEHLTAADADENEAIHEARKHFKKVRGLYRLVRSAVPDFYARENARVRDLARPLSGLRDATAMIETIDDLRSHLSAEIAPDSLSTVRDNLLARRDRIVGERGDVRERMRAAAADCEGALRALDGFAIDAGGRKEKAAIVAAGWCRICAQGRRALKACAETGDAAAFHDLRKRVKYHWMHLRLVALAWPGPMRLGRREARAIGDVVGNEHNLSLLAAIVREDAGAVGTAADCELLMRLLGDRQAALRAEALRRAGILFLDKPGRDARRLGLLWRQAS